MTSQSEHPSDAQWDDPLPHSQSPTKFYLSHPVRGQTKAAVIFMHGRGDNANDMVDVFLPFLQQRFGGRMQRLGGSDPEQSTALGPLTLIGIEARDNTWYPNSHNAETGLLSQENEPYQHSALDKIRKTIMMLHEGHGLSLEQIVFVGFSQGGLLGNTYLIAGLEALLQPSEGNGSVPLPGHLLSLAGSVFKVPPRFPVRGYASQEQREKTLRAEGTRDDSGRAAPRRIRARLLCGTVDRYFTEEEIKSAAAQIGAKAQSVRESDKLDTEVVLSVGFEDGQGHIITPKMVAAVAEAVDEILSRVSP